MLAILMGEHRKFYPYKKGEAEKVLAMLKGGTQSFEVVLTALKGGGRKMCYPVLNGGGAKSSDPRFSYFVAPLPVINDQSLKPIAMFTHCHNFYTIALQHTALRNVYAHLHVITGGSY